MYCLISSSGAPPTVETKYELLQRVGSLVVSSSNSSIKTLDEYPLICLMAFITQVFMAYIPIDKSSGFTPLFGKLKLSVSLTYLFC